MKANERIVVSTGNIDPRKSLFEVRYDIIRFCRQIRDFGFVIRVRSALRTCALDLISEVRETGNKVFADGEYLEQADRFSLDAQILADMKPEMVSVSIYAEPALVQLIRKKLPGAEVVVNIHAYSAEDVRWNLVRNSEILNYVDSIVVRPQIAELFPNHRVILAGVCPPWIPASLNDPCQIDSMPFEEAVALKPERVIVSFDPRRDQGLVLLLGAAAERLAKSKLARGVKTRPALQA